MSQRDILFFFLFLNFFFSLPFFSRIRRELSIHGRPNVFLTRGQRSASAAGLGRTAGNVTCKAASSRSYTGQFRRLFSFVATLLMLSLGKPGTVLRPSSGHFTLCAV